MKKIFFIITLSLMFCISTNVAYCESLPELPNLPAEVEFDSVIPPDDMDVFAPSSTPSQTVTKSTTTPIQQTSTIKVTPVKTGSNNGTTTANKSTSQYSQTKQTQVVCTKSNNNTNALYKTVKKGKKFKVKLAQTVSSSTPSGTKISFKSLYPETSTYVTIPAGTTFYGQVTNSHVPQYTGNGGLIEINVTQMVYNGKSYPIDAKVSIANNKRIFLNNIKGQRMYLRSFPKAMKTGTRYFSKMWKVTKILARNQSGVEIILTPFSFAAGSIVYVANLAVSPVLAMFYKGKSISIPANSPFTIQLRNDVNLY